MASKEYKQIRDFRDSKKVNSVSAGAQIFFVRCFMEADDYGVLRGQRMLLRSLLWPDEEFIQYETNGPKIEITAQIVEGWMRECVMAELIIGYIIDHKPYIQIVNFNQKGLTHPKSLYPKFDISTFLPMFPDVSRIPPEIEVEIDIEVETEVDKASRLELTKRIIDCLNLITSSSYRYQSANTQSHITARLREKFSFDDFQTVIIHKMAEWGDEAKWQKFLRPKTLFGTNFEGYLQAAKREKRMHIVSKTDQLKKSITEQIKNELTTRTNN